jgi:type II secretory pathway component GspD/PulD (secretin)
MFPWGVQVGYSTDKTFTNALLLTLNLMKQNDDLAIVASPEILAQDSREAEIKVTTDEYFQISAVGGLYVQSQLEKIESGTIMKITPRIGDRGEITLEMNVEVSDVVARGSTGLPVVNRRSAKSTLRVRDGGTAAVAGLMDTRNSANRRKVPFVGDVPGLNALFTKDDNRSSSKQVAIFITATLVTDNKARSEPKERHPAQTVDPVLYRQQLSAALKKLDKLRGKR